MTFHPTMKRRLHERLHPLIGEEEADALLDEISPPDPVTREWLRGELDARFAQVDARFAQVDERFAQVDERFAQVDERFAQVDARFEGLVTKDHLDERLDRFATKEWTEDRFDTKDHLDLKLEAMEHRILGAMHHALKQQIIWVYGAAGAFAVVISVVDRIWG